MHNLRFIALHGIYIKFSIYFISFSLENDDMESSKRIHTRKTIYLNLSPLHA